MRPDTIRQHANGHDETRAMLQRRRQMGMMKQTTRPDGMGRDKTRRDKTGYDETGLDETRRLTFWRTP